MAETMGVAEAKRRFSELIERVRAGERFVVTRRGKPVLALLPAETEEGESSGERPRGLLSVVGALADVEGFEETMREVYASRRKRRSRPVPHLEQS